MLVDDLDGDSVEKKVLQWVAWKVAKRV